MTRYGTAGGIYRYSSVRLLPDEVSNLHLARDFIRALTSKLDLGSFVTSQISLAQMHVSPPAAWLRWIWSSGEVWVFVNAQGKRGELFSCGCLLPWLLLSFITHVPKTTYLTYSKSVYCFRPYGFTICAICAIWCYLVLSV